MPIEVPLDIWVMSQIWGRRYINGRYLKYCYERAGTIYQLDAVGTVNYSFYRGVGQRWRDTSLRMRKPYYAI